jgi:hypothetical protein
MHDVPTHPIAMEIAMTMDNALIENDEARAIIVLGRVSIEHSLNMCRTKIAHSVK